MARPERAGMAGQGPIGQSPLRTGALLVGIVFLAVGILGFIPGVTRNFGDITFAGRESGAELFGLFQVSVLHNIVHLLFGLLGLAAARTVGSSRSFLVVGGVIYLLLALYGWIVDKGTGANFVPVNRADDWLHLGLGIGMVLLGLVLPAFVARGVRRA